MTWLEEHPDGKLNVALHKRNLCILVILLEYVIFYLLEYVILTAGIMVEGITWFA